MADSAVVVSGGGIAALDEDAVGDAGRGRDVRRIQDLGHVTRVVLPHDGAVTALLDQGTEGLNADALDLREGEEMAVEVRRRRSGCRCSGPPTDLISALARAGVVIRLEGRALQDAIKGAIGERRGYLGDWYVELLYPEREQFRGPTLEIALAWCLVCLMADELGIGAFAS